MPHNARVAQLEHTLLELGTEIYRLKHEMSSVTDFRDEFLKTLKALRQVLDDKGVISADDFDASVELLDQAAMQPGVPDFHSDLFEVERGKKISH
jgi:hypothetical protein